MRAVHRVLTIFVVVCLTTAPAQAERKPEIISQGFSITESQVGVVGKFGRLRVRIEAPNRIAELHIKERSYEVDLANTPDVAHLARFGLETRPRQKKDVTLNFQNYINEKLETEGSYEIVIHIIDKAGHATRATLAVSVTPKMATETERIDPIREQSFVFARVGVAPITGATRFGISWTTIDVENIVVRVEKVIGGAEKLSNLNIVDYATIETIDQLNDTMNAIEDVAAVEFSTANNGAAGKVFGIVNRGLPFIVKVSESDTSLSALGTSVTLRGTFKY